MTVKNPKILTNIGKSLSADGTKLLNRLTDDGFEIVSAADAAKILRAAVEETPDLILLNPKKRGTDGPALCRQLKAESKTSAIPVIFIADKASASEVVEALDAGAAEHLRKPFRQEEIIARLRMIVRAAKAKPPKDRDADGLEELVDALPALLLETDLEGNIYTFKAPQSHLGYAVVQKSRPKNLVDILPENPRLVLIDALGQVRESGKRVVASCFVKSKKGAGWLEFFAACKYSDRPCDRFVVLIHDITERKQAEKERADRQEILRQEQKMEGIGRLAGGISHGINDILGAIMGLASSMRIDFEYDSSYREEFEQIIAACRKGYELTSNLSSLSSEVSFNKERLSLNSMVEEARELLDTAIPDNITIETDLDPDCADFIGDPVMINHVCINLALNAADAMPQGGQLKFSTRSYIPPLEELIDDPDLMPGRYVILEVADTGEGMLPTVKERAFEPFFSTKSHRLGSGLGLPMVYGIVKSHGGRIVLDSEVGQGTSVKVFLPAFVPEEEDAAAGAMPKSVPPKTHTLLVVDDDELVLFANRRILKRLGYTVMTARSGADALLIYEEHANKISLVLLDLVMPEMDGAMTFKQLREIDPDVKVLICTGYHNDEITSKLIRHGAKGVLQKPFELEQLSVEIEKAIR